MKINLIKNIKEIIRKITESLKVSDLFPHQLLITADCKCMNRDTSTLALQPAMGIVFQFSF